MHVCERGLNTEACGRLLFVAVCYSKGWTVFFSGSESPGVSVGVFALLSRLKYGGENKRRDVKTVCVEKAIASSIFNVIK